MSDNASKLKRSCENAEHVGKNTSYPSFLMKLTVIQDYSRLMHLKACVTSNAVVPPNMIAVLVLRSARSSTTTRLLCTPMDVSSTINVQLPMLMMRQTTPKSTLTFTIMYLTFQVVGAKFGGTLELVGFSVLGLLASGHDCGHL